MSQSPEDIDKKADGGIQTDHPRIAHIVANKWFPAVIWTLRVLLGGVFVMSGLVKGIDLWGFIFKIEDYLSVWDMSQPRSIVVMAALLISAYEFIFGCLLVTGCYKRVAVWALTAMMAVMLPLTAYIAIFDPVSDCGCFGEFWVISNTWTFIKNILITFGLLILLVFNHRLKAGIFQPAIQWIVGAWITLYFIIVALYGYNVQPMVDFRPYPIGSRLIDKSPSEADVYGENDVTVDDEAEDNEAIDDDEADDDDDDDDEMTFVYQRNGVRQEFTLDNLPDSTWEFVERIESPHESDASARGADLVLNDADGEDVTEEALSDQGTELMVVIPEPERLDISYTYFLNELKQWADTSDVRMICVIASDRKGIAYWNDVSMAAYDVYSAEDTKLKELVRGTMAMVELRDGRVAAKYTLSSISGDIIDNGPEGKDLLDKMAPEPGVWFKTLTGLFVAGLLLLYLFQHLVLTVYTRIRGLYQKKAVNL